MIFDDIGRHLGEAGSFDRAAVPMGMYVAWCANHQLLSEALNEREAALVVRVRFRDITGSELVVAGCAGVLAAEHLNDEGRAFTEQYYGSYPEDFRATFGADPFAVTDDWDHYDRIAPVLTRALMAFRGRSRNHGAERAAGVTPRWRKLLRTFRGRPGRGDG